MLKYLICVPATRTIRGIPSEVFLDESDGMPQASAVALDQIATIPKAYFTELICQLGTARMFEVCRALRIATSC